MAKTPKDRLFDESAGSGSFEFDESVARVFDDMISRSVPKYKECQEMILSIAPFLCKANSRIYDLGCSTGTLLSKLADKTDPSVTLIGVDNSAAMLAKARRKLNKHKNRVEFIEADLANLNNIDKAQLVILNYTLQFIAPRKRLDLIKKIHAGMGRGGALILIEKVKGKSLLSDKAFNTQHVLYKEKHGYSKMQIANKRQALENVLIPFKLEQNEALLIKAGFKNIDLFFKWFNFAGWLAIK